MRDGGCGSPDKIGSRRVARTIQAGAAVAIAAAVVALVACASKPSERMLHANLVEDLKAEGLSSTQAIQFADCATPKLLDELSASSLNAIIDDGAEEAKMGAEDAGLGEAIMIECAEEVLGG